MCYLFLINITHILYLKDQNPNNFNGEKIRFIRLHKTLI